MSLGLAISSAARLSSSQLCSWDKVDFFFPKISPKNFFTLVHPMGPKNVARGSFGSSPAVWQFLPFPSHLQPGGAQTLHKQRQLCIKAFFFFFLFLFPPQEGQTWRLCGHVCLNNDPGPFLCLPLQEKTLSLFSLCNPRHLNALWHGLTQEVQPVTPGTSFLFLEEHSRLTIFSEDQTSLLSCQCLELKVELMF